ncbi:MAG TPA: hypothetical protein VNG93_04725 [Candidatus Dormibacteraeota bacterium]|nr:hypothetical protein [Candidatus Dormibacteraeota bacterium]
MKRSLEPSPRLITSESHGGAPWVALVSYLALAVVAAGWLSASALKPVEGRRPSRPRGRQVSF